MGEVDQNKIAAKVILVSLVVWLALGYFEPNIVSPEEPYFLIGSLALLISIFLLVYSVMNTSSTLVMSMCFYYFSFGMIFPAIVYLSDRNLPWPVALGMQTDYLYFKAFIAVLLFLIFFGLGCYTKSKYNDKISIPRYELDSARVIVVASFLLCIGGAICLYAGVEYIFTPRYIINQDMNETKEFALFKRAPFFIFTAALLLASLIKNKMLLSRNVRVVVWALFVAAVVFLFVVSNPVNSARWRLVGFAVGIFLIFDPANSRAKKNFFVIAMVFGSIFLYPLLNMLARSSSQWEKLIGGEWRDYFSAGDFDGFQSISIAVLYVQENGYQLGYQILNAFVSFVPRALWADKPRHSGALVSSYYGAEMDNLSMPFPGEFFLDFGFLGVVVMAYVAGRIYKKLNYAVLYSTSNSYFIYLAAVTMGANSLFLQRGALIAALEFLLTICIVQYFVSKYVCRDGSSLKWVRS